MRTRKGVFGAIETKLVATERVTTANNCIAQDMVPGGRPLYLWLQCAPGPQNACGAGRCVQYLSVRYPKPHLS
ncbi:DNA repair ATPase [Cesiribacter andamanensis]|uniref:DNA repair ATPase n=1 Tax=Cesiribacter andamanensis TaxID=649507 RepID=UPI00373FE129